MGATGRCSVKKKSDDVALAARFAAVSKQTKSYQLAIILLWPEVPEKSFEKLECCDWKAFFLNSSSSPELKAFALGKMAAVGASFEEWRQWWRNFPELRPLALAQMEKLGDRDGWLRELAQRRAHREPELEAFYMRQAINTTSECEACFELFAHVEGEEEMAAVWARIKTLASTTKDWCLIYHRSEDAVAKRWALVKIFVSESFDDWNFFLKRGACCDEDQLFALLQMERLAASFDQWALLHRLGESYFPEVSQRAFAKMRELAAAIPIETSTETAKS